MRRFQNEQFPSRLADAFSSIYLEVPNQEAQEALDYIKQFIQRSTGNSRLHRGYLPEEYIDLLLIIRDTNGNRDFADAIENIGAGRDTSEEVTEFDNFEVLEVNSDGDLLEELDKVYYQVNSTEARKNVRTLQDLIRNTRDGNHIQMYLPQESYTDIRTNLTSQVI